MTMVEQLIKAFREIIASMESVLKKLVTQQNGISDAQMEMGKLIAMRLGDIEARQIRLENLIQFSQMQALSPRHEELTCPTVLAQGDNVVKSPER